MKKALFVLSLFALPVVAFAQNAALDPIVGTVQSIGQIIRMLVPIVSLIAVIYFFYGLAKYILSAGDAAKAEEGKSIMIWGALAMFVLVSIWGIIGFIQASLGTNRNVQNVNVDLPDVEPARVGDFGGNNGIVR